MIGAGVVGLAVARALEMDGDGWCWKPPPRLAPAVRGVAGLVNLFGIESPGLTSSLAIGEYVSRLLATL